MSTDRNRFTVSLNPELFREVEEYRVKHNYATRSKAVEALIAEGIELLVVEGRIPDVRQPPPPPPVPRDLTEEMEKLLQTLTPEQALLLVTLAKKALKYAESKPKAR